MMKSTSFIRLVNFIVITFMIILVSWSCVIVQATPPPAVEESIWPTPASNLQELIENISNGNEAVKIVSIYALEEYGNNATLAIPVLIESLYDKDSDVRKAAIYMLGKLGTKAKIAVPDLIYVLENDNAHHPQRDAAEALGDIGDSTAIPALAQCLYNKNYSDGDWLQIICAKSIGEITGENFTDINSVASYVLNEDGVPYIVIDAQNWWIAKGQYRNWKKSK